MGRIRAGNLDRVVFLLRRGDADHDGFRPKPGAWAQLGKRKASIRPARGSESVEQQGTVARAELTVWLRSDELTRSLTALDGIAVDGQRYELTAPPVMIGRREGVELFVKSSGEGWVAP